VSEAWVTRFINRHEARLVSHWITGIDHHRHEADSEINYKAYFDLVHQNMRQYNVEPRHTYNTDEKCCLIGLTGRTKSLQPTDVGKGGSGISSRMDSVSFSPSWHVYVPMDQCCPWASPTLLPKEPFN
jgi:hypothetical protein